MTHSAPCLKMRNFQQQPFAMTRQRPYITAVLRDYEHKRARNTRIGPGGGTRRLHQTSFIWGSWGRNRIDERLKGLALFRLSATVIGENCTIANDNRAPVAMAA
jgi:hypothetical protein